MDQALVIGWGDVLEIIKGSFGLFISQGLCLARSFFGAFWGNER